MLEPGTRGDVQLGSVASCACACRDLALWDNCVWI